MQHLLVNVGNMQYLFLSFLELVIIFVIFQCQDVTKITDFDHSSEWVQRSLHLNHQKTRQPFFQWRNFSIMVRTQDTPLLKMPGLSINDLLGLASYKLIWSLSTTIKVLDRLYLAWLLPHVVPSLRPLQPAYRKLHSSETALLKMIINDMFDAVDLGRTTILIIFDLSTAFDNIDHSILLNRFESSFGVTLSWVKLYLTDQTTKS